MSSLEATMIIIDNSDWARNGDFPPTRWDAQQDAANLICEAKLGQNQESCVGIMTMAGRRVEVHLTPSTDIGRMISIIHNIKIAREEINLVNSLKIAQLVLKHRQNRNQQQRIIIFIGSPVVDSLDKLERVCKLMKKNNIGMDIINFGGAGNTAPITRMIEKVDNQGNSHFLNLEAGAFMLSDALISSPILMRGGGAAGLGAGGGLGGLGEGGNVDPNEDPELAMAIRISMEEARADRQDPLPQGDVGGDGEGPLIAPVEGGEVPPPPPPVEEEYINMDDENLQEQLLAHLEEGAKRIDQDVKELHQAESISSYRDAEKTAKEIVKNMDPSQEELKDAFEDKDFISGLLKDLPGIEEGEIANIVAQVGDDEKEETKEKTDEEKKKKEEEEKKQ